MSLKRGDTATMDKNRAVAARGPKTTRGNKLAWTVSSWVMVGIVFIGRLKHTTIVARSHLEQSAGRTGTHRPPTRRAADAVSADTFMFSFNWRLVWKSIIKATRWPHDRELKSPRRGEDEPL